MLLLKKLVIEGNQGWGMGGEMPVRMGRIKEAKPRNREARINVTNTMTVGSNGIRITVESTNQALDGNSRDWERVMVRVACCEGPGKGPTVEYAPMPATEYNIVLLMGLLVGPIGAMVSEEGGMRESINRVGHRWRMGTVG